ncbi:hypothetical protein C8T65DRAFT_223846 [Cerioporus squamosus]|nr:hypothetical protein C8T65DRAFT_223846 [Cerioporus squamosus]
MHALPDICRRMRKLESCGFYIPARCFVRLPVSGHIHLLPFYMIISDHIFPRVPHKAQGLRSTDCNESRKRSILSHRHASQVYHTPDASPRGNQIRTAPKIQRYANQKSSRGREDRATCAARRVGNGRLAGCPGNMSGRRRPWATTASLPAGGSGSSSSPVLGSAARDAISVIDEANSNRVAVTENSNQRGRTASLCSHALSPRGPPSHCEAARSIEMGGLSRLLARRAQRSCSDTHPRRAGGVLRSSGRTADARARCRRGIPMDKERTKTL